MRGALLWPVLILVLASPALGVVGLGHMQPVQEVTIPQGQRYTTPLYFYNAYGDRITHVSVTVTSAPSKIRVTLDPAAHLAQYNVSGIIANVTENTIACPRARVASLPPGAETSLDVAKVYVSNDPLCPATTAYIKAPLGEGYLPSAVVNVTFDVPEDTPPGAYSVRVDASGFVVGERGQVLPGISGGFDYNILVNRPGPLTEVPVTPAPKATPAPGPDLGGLLAYAGIGAAVVGGMAGMYFLGRRGKP